MGGMLIEIYGSTESGQVATRRPTQSEVWETFGEIRVRAQVDEADGERFIFEGDFIPEPTPMADILELIDARSFRLLGRANDLIHVAGRRSSLGYLNHHLNSIPGVEDGAFWLPDDVTDGVVRPVAFVVAPTLDAHAVIAALRERLEAVFVPRRVVHVAAFPREGTGKLTARALREFAAGAAGVRQYARAADARSAHRSPRVRRAFSGPAAAAGRAAAFGGAGGGAWRAGAGKERLGAQPTLAAAKFLAPVRPGSTPADRPRPGGRPVAGAALRGALRRRHGGKRSLDAGGRPGMSQLPPESGTAKSSRADWSRVPERSNMLALRVICWIALKCGRPLTRLILHPICLYFLLFSPSPRRQIKRYLFRAVGPGAGWGDGYRLLHTFASTVLDRIYFLRARLDLFDVNVYGNVPVEAEAQAGRGAFLLGAHIGSFEAMGACKQQSKNPEDLRLAMLMYQDNAQQITAVLNAISKPEMRPNIIALGRPHSMLALRDWLDTGGLAGLLADRTLPGPEEAGQQRGSSVELPFLGKPAVFNDGPFRLAALLRRKVFFMAGLYAGGARYDVRFEPLADFSDRVSDSAERERRIRAALESYVSRLEALCLAYPYNWFNFHDFWLEDST